MIAWVQTTRQVVWSGTRPAAPLPCEVGLLAVVPGGRAPTVATREAREGAGLAQGSPAGVARALHADS